ncbi:HslU--HslV peptidase ATPase subunit [Candidatus Annandia adelgestsuga]|uniref:HslU--HslV peptidase ATPase subunit n=1 Tax=Candidatus Annandia adelgestsuga TaxID=1302411 RepID=UPI001E383FD1|nr:HslU--HslV peptidase ATPase subunit [Candidatus Annandia adelgestsuga]
MNNNDLDEQNYFKTKKYLRNKLRTGELDNNFIEINEYPNNRIGIEILAPLGIENIISNIQSIFYKLNNLKKKKIKKIKIKDAIDLLIEETLAKKINKKKIEKEAIKRVEHNGIVFIDEIDKICKKNGNNGPDVSREGVQRDLLPLIESCEINTKYGKVKTDYILFIASGAFQINKPSDLIPELQGRLPIKINMKSLTINDFEKILIEPDFSMIIQYNSLMSTEGVNLNFTKNGIKNIAKSAWNINEYIENIGARRLHTILENLMKYTLFNKNNKFNKNVIINKEYVDKYLEKLNLDENTNRFII